MSDFSEGFHGGPGGNHTGIGEYYHQLDEAGIPFFIKSADHYGHLFEAANIARASGVAHTMIFRLTTQGQNDGYDYDVPPYQFPPVEAAAIHWSRTIAKLPPEFDESLVWLEPVNEVDKDRADWLGHFAAEIALLALRDGYKVTLFGWSSGEPEPEHWQTAGMRRYLQMCAANHDRLAVALHEYSYDLNNIQDGFPNKIGRFQALFAACDAMGIGRPTVHITEWGWTHEEVPEPTQAMLDIRWAYNLYAPHSQLKGKAIWYLGSGYNNIANKAQRLIQPVTQFMLNPPPIDPEPEPEPGQTVHEYLWGESEAYAQQHGIQRLPQLGLWQELEARGYDVEHREITRTFEGRTYAIQRGERDGEKLLGIWSAGLPLEFITEPDDTVPPPAAFAAAAWPVNDLRLTQWFAANPENYVQFGLPGHDGTDHRAPTGTPVRAIAGGLVYAVYSSENYGLQVRLDHGNGHKTAYAHLLSSNVQVGQQVTAGQVIALADNTGNSSGSHLHLAYKQDGKTYTDPAGNIWPYNLFDPWLALRPLFESYLAQAGIAGYAWANSTVKHPHFDYAFGLTNLNLRQQPTTSAPILGLVPANTPFRITGPKVNGYYPAVCLLSYLPPGTQPPGNLIDLRRFKVADPNCWRVVRNQHGQQEDVQDMELGGGLFVRRKNDLAEWHKRDGVFFYLIHDTSPAPGTEGVERVYTLYKLGIPGAPKSRIQQAVGELWTEVGTHQVQFRAKNDCRNLAENSGQAQNNSTIIRYERNFPFNAYGQNLVFDEVIWERTGKETQIYGRKDGKSCGWIGWQETPTSPVTEPVEIHWDRGQLTQEPSRYCPF